MIEVSFETVLSEWLKAELGDHFYNSVQLSGAMFWHCACHVGYFISYRSPIITVIGNSGASVDALKFNIGDPAFSFDKIKPQLLAAHERWGRKPL